MSEQRVIYIVIDPRRARSGASAVVDSLRLIDRHTRIVNRSLSASDRAVQTFSRNFSRMQALLITAQPVRFLSSFIRSMVEADKTITTFKSQLFTVTGDLEAAGESFEYLKKTAQAYAVPINSLTKGFAKLKASMNTPELAQYNEALFQSTVILSSVLHLAEYNSERVFNVMIQIMSKGQLMMEELKQQLGEHVPGAIALAAESMGMSVKVMMDKMASGLISAEQFAAGWSKLITERFGPATEIATKSIQSAITRFNNVIQSAMIDLVESEAGFAIARMITSIVEKLDGASATFKVFGTQIARIALDINDYIQALKPKDIERFFKATIDLFDSIISMGAAFATGLIFLVTYKDEVEAFTKFAFGAWVATNSLAVATALLGTAMSGVGLITLAAAGAMGLLAVAIAAVGAALAGYAIGTYMYEQSETVRWAGNRIAMYLTLLYEDTKNTFERLSLKIKMAFDEPLNFIASRLISLLKTINSASAELREFFGLDPENKLMDNLENFLDDTAAGKMNKQITDLADKHEKETDRIKATYDELLEHVGDAPSGELNILDRLGLPEDFQTRMAEMRKELQRYIDEENAYFDSQGGGNGGDAGAMDKLLTDEASLRKSLETREEMINRSYFDTAAEIYRISEALNLSEKDRQDLSLRNYEDYTDKRIQLNKDQLAAMGEGEKTYWQQYLENMEKALTTGEELSTRMLDKLTSGIGDAVEEMVFEFTTFKDAFRNLMEQMLRALVNALAQMAASWLAYQVVKMFIDDSAAESSAVAQTQQALATQQQAAIASYASTAAIPVVGPELAPAAATAAIVATSPFVAAVAALSGLASARAMGGQVQDGQSYLVGERGPEMFTAGGTGHVTPNHQMSNGGGTNIVINDQTSTSSGHDFQTQETSGPEGQRQMQITIRDTVRRQVMQGEFDRQLGSKFDLKSKGRRV